MTDMPWELCELSTYSAVVEGVVVKVEKFWRICINDTLLSVDWGVDWGPRYLETLN